MIACGTEYTPKPKGYHRIDFPPKHYQTYASECPFSFEFPVYAKITPYPGTMGEPCWLNYHIPDFSAQIHLSYKPIHNKHGLDTLIEDSRNFVYKHTIKADAIDELLIKRSQLSGVYYEISGNTASSVQFFLTDSTANFIRGALYFNLEPNEDSLAPVISYIKEDIWHLINTLQWKNNP